MYDICSVINLTTYFKSSIITCRSLKGKINSYVIFYAKSYTNVTSLASSSMTSKCSNLNIATSFKFPLCYQLEVLECVLLTLMYGTL